MRKDPDMNRCMLAACGLNCENCEIRLAPVDPEAAEVIVRWFKSQGWLSENEGMPEVIKRKMYCTGCLGSRETHWSADCWILQCCVDDKHLDNCSQCPDFPCERLIEWSKKDDSYADAFRNLKILNDTRSLN